MKMRSLTALPAILAFAAALTAFPGEAFAQESAGEEVLDQMEQQRRERLQENAQQWMNRHVRQVLAEMPPRRPEHLEYDVRTEHVDRLCKRLELGPDGQMLAQSFFEEYRGARNRIDTGLQNLYGELGFTSEPYFRGETKIEDPGKRARERQELRRAIASANDANQECMSGLFAQVAALATALSDQAIEPVREAWTIDTMLNPSTATATYFDLGVRINLIDILEEMAEEHPDLAELLDSSQELEEFLSNYRTQLYQQVRRRAAVYPMIRKVEIKSRETRDEGTIDRLQRMVNGSWNAYWALNKTSAASVEAVIRSELSAEMADAFRAAVLRSNFPSTHRADAAEQMHEWITEQSFDLPHEERDAIMLQIDGVITRHASARAADQARLREVSIELREIEAAGPFAVADDEERLRLLRERSELHMRHRKLMDETMAALRAVVPDRVRDAFAKMARAVVNADAPYCHNYVY